jgi:hypothetical protein
MNPIEPYQNLPPVSAPQTTVEKSVSRDGAFSKPGTTKSKGWSPAKGTRFRPTSEKAKGRPRKRPRDVRNVQFF